MNIYLATDHEAGLARQAFGPDVRSVTFWDAEEADDGFDLIVGYDGDNQQIGRLDPEGTPRLFARFSEIADWRGQTVKFGLEL
jgi:hypothetical protein